MNPQIIAVDEITVRRTCGAMPWQRVRSGAAGHHSRRRCGGACAKASLPSAAGRAGLPAGGADYSHGASGTGLPAGDAAMLKLLGSALILGAGAWLRWNTLAQQRRQRQTASGAAECAAADGGGNPHGPDRPAAAAGAVGRAVRTGRRRFVLRRSGGAAERGAPGAVWRTLSGELPLPASKPGGSGGPGSGFTRG